MEAHLESSSQIVRKFAKLTVGNYWKAENGMSKPADALGVNDGGKLKSAENIGLLTHGFMDKRLFQYLDVEKCAYPIHSCSRVSAFDISTFDIGYEYISEGH